MTQQAKTNDVVITLTVKALIAQSPFLLETQGLMEADGALVVRYRLTTNFV